ncbi:hypothetical protein [Mesorhizobium sp. KR2-14]|uniref:hypothetical protein n=1 Tax=Mesorhizobium sp. KR2-14 TaxID=3156610 RepID=UPI0032B3CE1D
MQFALYSNLHTLLYGLPMRDMALQAAGLLAIFVAITHGAIAELKVFPRARIGSRPTATLLRMVWQASTISWVGIGMLLIAAPTFEDLAREWIAAIAIVVYGYAAIGNATVTRLRHIGWLLMTTVVGLSLVGF